MTPVQHVSGPGIPLLLDDIDTDRIIPARYLRCVTFAGLGEHAFEDDREQAESHPFDNPAYQDAKILVAGRNFGCGSSREHAPQALMRWGLEAIVAESFAEIFFGNCTGLGVPCVTASRSDLEKLASAIKADPTTELALDLEALTINAGSETVPVSMPDSARDALTSGQWDFLSQLLEATDEIKGRTEQVPYFDAFGSAV